MLAVAAAALPACAKKAPSPSTAAPPPVEQTAAAAPSDPTTPAGAVAVSKALVAHHRTVYSAANARYSYFIGGELFAEYEPDSRVLVLTGQGANEGAVCKYSADGVLFVEPKNAAGHQTEVAQCNALITRLYQNLLR